MLRIGATMRQMRPKMFRFESSACRHEQWMNMLRPSRNWSATHMSTNVTIITTDGAIIELRSAGMNDIRSPSPPPVRKLRSLGRMISSRSTHLITVATAYTANSVNVAAVAAQNRLMSVSSTM